MKLKIAIRKLSEDDLLVGRHKIFKSQGEKTSVIIGNQQITFTTGTPFSVVWLENLRLVLGEQWLREESQKPPLERHIIIRWMGELFSTVHYVRNALDKNPNLLDSVWPGDYISLTTFAYDVYSILHNGNDIPQDVLNRVKGKQGQEQILGAMYEVRLAGLFSRAGYKINWFKSNQKNKIPEFIVKHKYFMGEIAIEGKTISRPGVFTRPGEKPELEDIRALIGGHYDKASVNNVQKNTHPEFRGKPYLIFIDMNWPFQEDILDTFERWSQAIIIDILSKIKEPTHKQPSNFNGIWLTNFSWHYDSMKPIQVLTPDVFIGSHSAVNKLEDPNHQPLIKLAIEQQLGVLKLGTIRL